MHRYLALASLALLCCGVLAGCGQKGPLVLPPRPVTTPPSTPANSVAKPATAASAAAPASASRND